MSDSVLRGKDVFRWPECKAFLTRLGAYDMQATRITLDMPVLDSVKVTIEKTPKETRRSDRAKR